MYAYTSELDEWWETRRTRLAPSIDKAERPFSHRKVAVIAAAILVAIAACWASWSVWLAEPSLRVAVVPLTSYHGVELSPSLSPDGSHVAFSWDGEDRQNRDIYIKVIGADPAVRLTRHPAADNRPRLFA